MQRQVTFGGRLKGRLSGVGPGILEGELTARGIRVATRLEFHDETTFQSTRTIALTGGSTLRAQSRQPGSLGRSSDDGRRHGTSVLDVVGGTGRYAGASGRVTSNFVISPNGEVTDEQVAVLFIDQEGV